MKRRILPVLIAMVLCQCSLNAGIVVPVVKKGSSSEKSSIDITALQAGGSGAALFYRTLSNDLSRSGYFTIAPAGGGSMQVVGSTIDSGASLNVRCQVRARIGKVYLDESYKGESKQARKLAHKVSDEILWAVKQVKGLASTRIILVGNVGGKKDLYAVDADGGNMTQLTRDGAPCIAPRWSPDGKNVTYVSYRAGYGDLYVMDLAASSWRRLSNFPGMNGGGDIAPDGRTAAVILSKDGNPELYTMSIRGGRPSRLTQTRNIAEASPSWSPDGRSIVYVSNAARLPQLYVMDLAGSAPRRLPLIGNENVSPDWGPSGIVRSSRREGRYKICVYDPNSGTDTTVSRDGFDDEEPSWAPDGRHIACTRTGGNHSDVYILDMLGDPPVRLTTLKGEWYSPAWSPK